MLAQTTASYMRLPPLAVAPARALRCGPGPPDRRSTNPRRPFPTASCTSAPLAKNLYPFNASGCGQSTCSPLWSGLTSDFIDSSPSVANGVVYVGSNNLLYAFHANGCGGSALSPLWLGQADGQQGAIVSAPALANGLVYVSENNGMVMVFNASGCGKLLCLPLTQLFTNNEPIVSSSPAVVNGTVYVGSADQLSVPVGRLYVFKRSR